MPNSSRSKGFMIRDNGKGLFAKTDSSKSLDEEIIPTGEREFPQQVHKNISSVVPRALCLLVPNEIRNSL